MPDGGKKSKHLVEVTLTEDQHARWMELATRFGCLALTGKTVGQPSIRRMISEIGDGKFVISDKQSHGARPSRSRSKAKKPHAASPAGDTPAPIAPPSAEGDIRKIPSDFPMPPAWFPRDDDGGCMPGMPVSMLSFEQREEAKALGLEISNGEVWPHREWFHPRFYNRPQWWPEGSISRDELVALITEHGFASNEVEVDEWCESHGEWVMDGDRYRHPERWS